MIFDFTGKEDTEHSPISPKVNCIPWRVSCGGHFTVVLTSDGDVFSSGSGKYGRLGMGNEENQSTFQKVPLPEKIIQVCLFYLSYYFLPEFQ